VAARRGAFAGARDEEIGKISSYIAPLHGMGATFHGRLEGAPGEVLQFLAPLGG
jgi:hypothetical protein